MNPLKVPRVAAEGIRLGGHASDTHRVVNGPAERLSHLMLAVSDLARSEEWYQEVVGLDLLGRNVTVTSGSATSSRAPSRRPTSTRPSLRHPTPCHAA